MKFGALRGPDGALFGNDARPAAVKNFLAYTLKRLGTDYVDLYQPARRRSRSADRGYGRRHRRNGEGGLTCATSACLRPASTTIRRAHEVHPIAALQIEYSLMSRALETEILPALRELGISLVAYGVLSRGLISDHALTGANRGEIRAAHAALPGRQSSAQPRAGGGLAGDRKGEELHHRAACHRLGARRAAIDVIPLIGAKRAATQRRRRHSACARR